MIHLKICFDCPSSPSRIECSLLCYSTHLHTAPHLYTCEVVFVHVLPPPSSHQCLSVPQCHVFCFLLNASKPFVSCSCRKVFIQCVLPEITKTLHFISQRFRFDFTLLSCSLILALPTIPCLSLSLCLSSDFLA